LSAAVAFGLSISAVRQAVWCWTNWTIAVAPTTSPTPTTTP
jgi:hypothetical protein